MVEYKYSLTMKDFDHGRFNAMKEILNSAFRGTGIGREDARVTYDTKSKQLIIISTRQMGDRYRDIIRNLAETHSAQLVRRAKEEVDKMDEEIIGPDSRIESDEPGFNESELRSYRFRYDQLVKLYSELATGVEARVSEEVEKTLREREEAVRKRVKDMAEKNHAEREKVLRAGFEKKEESYKSEIKEKNKKLEEKEKENESLALKIGRFSVAYQDEEKKASNYKFDLERTETERNILKTKVDELESMVFIEGDEINLESMALFVGRCVGRQLDNTRNVSGSYSFVVDLLKKNEKQPEELDALIRDSEIPLEEDMNYQELKSKVEDARKVLDLEAALTNLGIDISPAKKISEELEMIAKRKSESRYLREHVERLKECRLPIGFVRQDRESVIILPVRSNQSEYHGVEKDLSDAAEKVFKNEDFGEIDGYVSFKKVFCDDDILRFFDEFSKTIAGKIGVGLKKVGLVVN